MRMTRRFYLRKQMVEKQKFTEGEKIRTIYDFNKKATNVEEHVNSI